jgi:hypothetical protein
MGLLAPNRGDERSNTSVSSKVRVGPLPPGIAAGRGHRHHDRLAPGDDDLVESYVFDRIAQHKIGRRRLQTQGLVDHVRPEHPPTADQFRLFGVGQQ